MISQELNHLGCYFDEAKIEEGAQWFAVVRTIATGRAFVEMEYSIAMDFGGEEGLQRALMVTSKPQSFWKSVVKRLTLHLVQTVGLDGESC